MADFRITGDTGGAGGSIRDTPAQAVAPVPIGPLFRLPGYTDLPGLPARPYPDSGWAPEARAQLLLADFLSAGALKTVSLPAVTPESGTAEIADLVTRAAGRDAIMAEFLAQDAGPLRYWANLLSITPAMPRTWDVIVGAQAIGRASAAFFKAHAKRPRPAQVSPGLMPPVQTTLTPSHPGGHATEAYLIAECLYLVDRRLKQRARALADRIAANREVAGLNYPSDSTAAASLASQIAATLAPPAPLLFSALLSEARLEWGISNWDGDTGGAGGDTPVTDRPVTDPPVTDPPG